MREEAHYASKDRWGWREEFLELCGWEPESLTVVTALESKILGRGNTEAPRPAGRPDQSDRSIGGSKLIDITRPPSCLTKYPLIRRLLASRSSLPIGA
ncbi:hypothetical protein PAHAL_3G303000 [Panicum hallii]|uniref:Uncharacterized protein n=1 Tax=Panicum hallii TaxID=206008 RepID=A0A2T8KJY4_9POAL|nr:hypothetical protein PAHAL_3G303000 [Panicum hallii]